MAVDSEFLKKLQVFLVAALVIAGGRAAYIVYERHATMREEAKPKLETALKAGTRRDCCRLCRSSRFRMW